MTYPLTHGQLGVFAECIRFPQSTHYSLPTKTVLPKSVDLERVMLAHYRVINAITSFNIRLVWEEGKIRQTLRDKSDFTIPHLHMTREEELAFEQNEFLRPFDIFKERLIRIYLIETEDHYIFLENFHHLVADGTSLRVYMDMLSDVYTNNTEPKETFSVFDYALAQQAFDSSEQHEAIKQYYIKQASDTDYPLTTAAAPTQEEGKALLETIDLPREQIDTFCATYQQRASSLFQAAYSLTLSSILHSDAISYSTLYHGRTARASRQAIGMFIATVPLYEQIDRCMSVRDFILHFVSTQMLMIRHADFSLIDVMQTIGEVPETVFSFQSESIRESVNFDGVDYPNLQIRTSNRTATPLSAVVYVSPDSYQIRLECSSNYHDEAYLQCFGRAMKACLLSLMKNIDGSLQDISVLPEEDRIELNTFFGSTPTHPKNSILKEIMQQAQLRGEQPAVVGANGTLTYRQLIDGATQVAAHLHQEGVLPGQFVAVRMNREAEYMIATLGVLAAGCAYIPVDPTYPQERQSFMLTDSQAGYELTYPIIQEWLNQPITNAQEALKPISALATTKAYMIYTSGSTGKPKGVVITHLALTSFCHSIAQQLALTEHDRISCHSSFSFDASIEDLFPILSVGGTLYIVPEELRRDVPALAQWLQQNAITGGNYTTRFGQMLLGAVDLPSLRYLVVGGEKMTLWPNRNRHIRVINTYGPTEATVDATAYTLTEQTDIDNIPIGTPLNSLQALVCDHCGHVMPLGLRGELYLTGDQIAHGYWYRPEETKKRFVYMTNEVDGKNYRFYKTGDIVRWEKQNGQWQLLFVGRDDKQVKFNGFRIELGDIENQIRSLAHVADAKAVVFHRGNNDVLCAYYTADQCVGADSLRDELKQHLPSYMVPSVLTQLEAMPLTPVGKIDTTRLPEPDAPIVATQAEPPANATESALVSIIQSVLGISTVGVTDDIVSLGATSIQLIQVAIEAESHGIHISMEAIHTAHTIRDLATLHQQETYLLLQDDGHSDIDVVFCGTTSLMQVRSYSERRHHPVLLFPPLDVTNSTITLEEIIDDYIERIRSIAGSRAIHSFIGHSFGGEVAYRVALEWEKRMGQTPELILLDTSMRLPSMSSTRLVTKQVEKAISAMDTTNKIFWQTYWRNALFTERLHDEKKLRGYKGSITLYNALQRHDIYLSMAQSFSGASEDKIKQALRFFSTDNARHWRVRHPNIRVVDINAGHFDLLNDEYIQ